MRATVLFDNIGPYHQARLVAASRVSDLTAVQVVARSAEYAWDHTAGAESFHLVTLFPPGGGPDVQGREVREKMTRALENSRPEVVFIPGWSSRAALTALAWCRRQRVPAVVMSESTAWDETRSRLKEWVKRRVISLFSAALAGGLPQADYLVQLGMDRDAVACGYDAVDNDYFRQKAHEIRTRAEKVRQVHGLPQNYFLASARFIEKKNLPFLLQAYAGYRSLHLGSGGAESTAAPWSLVLLGDGALRPALEAQIARLHLQDHVLLPGFVQYPDLPAYYALAGAFVHASTVEQWGLVVNEAMSSRLPVLVSNRCGCAPDLVQEGRNGHNFDPHDEEKLPRLFYGLSAAPASDRNAMGLESERIIAGWGPQRFAEGFTQAARKALSAPVSPAPWFDRLLLQGLLIK